MLTSVMSQPRQKATAKPTTKVAMWWMKAPSFSLIAFCTLMESSFRPASRPPVEFGGIGWCQRCAVLGQAVLQEIFVEVSMMGSVVNMS